MVSAVHSACRLPVIGIGGISGWADAVEFLLCGATAVQVGTALFVEPETPVKIVRGLREYMRRKKLKTINDLVGRVRKYG